MGLKVLVVDDDMINRMLLKTLLKKNGKVTDIVEAENGSDALDKMKKDPGINLILLDDDTKKTEVFDNGANDFIRKPVKEEALFAKIDQWSE